MIKASLKYFFLFIVACALSILLYYYVVPKEDQTPISIEMSK